MLNVPYRASCFIARRNRDKFVKRLPSLKPVVPTTTTPAVVYSFSGERDWPEQVASIRSFLRFVGKPKQFIVVSDGSHSTPTKNIIESLNDCVSVVSLDSILKPNLSARIHEYASQHFLGKKLAMLSSIPVDEVSIYTDSDILYFPGAALLSEISRTRRECPWYLLDCYPSLDERLLISEDEKNLPVNGGFLILFKALDWTAAIDRLERMQGDCVFFTEQTLVHLTMRANGAQPLPADQFILRAEDQFKYYDWYARSEIVLRHYVGPIRTKFWHQPQLFS